MADPRGVICLALALAGGTWGATSVAGAATAPPPTVKIVSPVPGATIPASGQISFTSDDPTATFACALGSAQRSCTSPWSYGPLSPGYVAFSVTATAADGQSAMADARYLVEIVTITSAPSGTVQATSASVAFTSSDPAETLTCTLDGTALAPCTSPEHLSGLALGSHTFTVTAAAEGQTGQATATWTVASSPPPPPPRASPRVISLSGPSGTIKSRSARFTFRGNAAAAAFQCSLDHAPFVGCSSGTTYRRLGLGAHEFAVRATDAQGNPGAAKSRNWVVAEGAAAGAGWLVPVIVLSLALVAAVATLAVRRVARERRRAAWQLEAHAKPPEGACQERSRYCEKTKITLKPGPREVAYLELHAQNAGGEAVVKRLDGDIVSTLNRAVHSRRRHEESDAVRRVLLPAATVLVAEAEDWPDAEAVQEEVKTHAHLIAGEAEFEFTLYRCEKTPHGPQWETEDKWTASLEDERDERVADLHLSQPLGEQIESTLAQLTDFVGRVDEHASLKVSMGLSAGG